MYKVSSPYHPSYEKGFRWDDPDVKIEWPIDIDPIVSERDQKAPFLREIEFYSGVAVWKKIWICGASGMLGSHFTRLLTERAIPFLANDYQQVDITQLDAVSDFVRLQKITHIINCAAYTQVDKAEDEQKQAYVVNAMGPHHLGIAARRHGARVLHFSTDYVFDGRGRVPYTEDHSCTPIGAYGMSKLAGEIKLLDEHDTSASYGRLGCMDCRERICGNHVEIDGRA